MASSRYSICFVLTIASVISAVHSRSYAGGFAVDEQGAVAMGRANAFAAQADDPTALFYNPAGIAQLHGTQVSLGTTLISPATTFQSQASGNSTNTESVLFFPPTLYLAHEIRPSVHAGIGVFIPFGLSTEWPANWEGRYLTTFSEINTMYINPNVVWSPTPDLHLATGITYVPSSVTLRNKLDLTPSPDGDVEIKADGDGWGLNVALLTTLPAHTSLGVSFRSAVHIDYTGDGTISPLGLSAQLNSSLTLPPIFTVGIAHHGLSGLTLEADWEWVGWSTFDKIAVTSADPTFVAETPKNWRDSSSLRLGAEYPFGQSALRAGYAYDMTPVPPETIDPSLPDSDKHTFALGGGHRCGRATVDLAYMFIVSRDRRVANTLPTGPTSSFDHRGTYSAQVHELGVGFSYRF
jgi:long-chain fatty acid transport protein